MTEAAAVHSDKPKPLAKVLVLLLLAILVIGAGTLYWILHKPHPAKDQANAFIKDMITGNLAAARARCTSDVDFDEMARLADPKTGKIRFWGKLTDQSGLALTTQGDRADVDGTLTFEQLSKTFSATLMKQPDGSYKITSYGFN